jgi:hypothetical protein
MTPTFALHSSTTELLNLCLGYTAELNNELAKSVFPEKNSGILLKLRKVP